MVVICDDPDREDEGDLCMAAELVTPEAITFMACQARGLICLSLPGDRCDELELPLMVPSRNGSDATGFCVSIEAATGVTTGISAADRARTIQVAMHPRATPSDLVRPGHVFPLRARARGVLERRGQTEAAVDLTRLASLTPGGVLCEVMNDDGTMARGPKLHAFCQRHSLPIVTVDEIATYRNTLEPAIAAV
jgi:3,4-dihydroxy 2-butanone 4-phosphate synthase/GTP cyclohydrolase II